MVKDKCTIGENIKKYRQKLAISQDFLSKKANLSFYTIAKIGAGVTPNLLLEPSKESRML